MKLIKRIAPLFVLAALLSSCAIKSLHAFYTKNLIYFEEALIGKWSESPQSSWNIEPFKDEILKDQHKTDYSQLDQENKKLYNNYKDGYVAYNIQNNSSTSYIVMPFKINNELFLDFIPLENQEENGSENNIYDMHLIAVHTLAKIEITSNNSLNIKWLDEKKLEALIKENKIKIKYDKVGLGENLLLTATSEDLVKFIKKYMKSEDTDKWKTDTEINLTRCAA
ncbi:hypothetical protein [Aegicerativicinus sediminis]|uniref:hypothetical protein n=1 Tax=Aegicerativicinus sediminis TaxID=2893202 RepID=UPI001E5470AF|nr:hypothetical protein [Aegicerativicinus sediminis]